MNDNGKAGTDHERAALCDRYMRRAFGVPMLVLDEHVPDVIARSMIDAEPGISDATFADTIDHARRYVIAFTTALHSGALDLALAGHGTVLKDATEDRKRHDMTAGETALAAIDVGGERSRLDWLSWLWSMLSTYVHEHGLATD